MLAGTGRIPCTGGEIDAPDRRRGGGPGHDTQVALMALAIFSMMFATPGPEHQPAVFSALSCCGAGWGCWWLARVTSPGCWQPFCSARASASRRCSSGGSNRCRCCRSGWPSARIWACCRRGSFHLKRWAETPRNFRGRRFVGTVGGFAPGVGDEGPSAR